MALMKLAIVDPPYLGRANRYYGNGAGGGGGNRKKYKPNFHPEASIWDKESEHQDLIDNLSKFYDGFAIAMSSHNLSQYLKRNETASNSIYRIGIWHKPSAVPSGSRITNSYEPVLFRIPDERRSRAKGKKMRDVLVANPPRVGFLGAKPNTWTHWVLDVLGYENEDIVDDLFPGSGIVSEAILNYV